MNHERVDEWLERGILACVAAMLVYSPLALGAVRSTELVVVVAIAVVALFLWLVRVWVRGEVSLLWPPVAWAVVAFVALAFVRYRQAEIEYVAREEFLKILLYAAVFFTILNNLHRSDAPQVVVFALVAVGIGLSFYAGFQFFTKSGHVWHFLKPVQYTGRGSGTFINPNHLAGFLELVLPLAITFTLMSRLGHAAKVVTGYAALVIVAGIGFTVSRGGWIASVLGLLLLAAFVMRRRGSRIAMLAFCIVIAGVAGGLLANSQFSQRRFEQMIAGGRLDDVRFQLWKPTVQMWRDHLWLGVGPAHFDHRFPEYRPRFIQMSPDRAHNDYLNLLADWGVVGAAIVAAGWALLFAGVFKAWKFVQRGGAVDGAAQPSTRAAFVLGAVAALASLLLHAVTDFNFHIPSNALVATAFAALLAGSSRFATERHWLRCGTVGKIFLTLALLAVIGWLSATAAQRWREDSLLARAAKPGPGDNSLALLEQAATLEPKNFETSHTLGEILRRAAWETRDEAQIGAAMKWFTRSIEADRYFPFSFIGRGMCLDWLGRHDEAGRDFAQAGRLDPEGYYTLAHRGWHELEIGNDARAKEFFEASQAGQYNPIANSYLELLLERAAEKK